MMRQMDKHDNHLEVQAEVECQLRLFFIKKAIANIQIMLYN